MSQNITPNVDPGRDFDKFDTALAKLKYATFGNIENRLITFRGIAAAEGSMLNAFDEFSRFFFKIRMAFSPPLSIGPGRLVPTRLNRQAKGRSGLGLAAQREAVARYLNGGRWKLVAEYVEVESGKRNSRPQLQAAISHAKATGAKLVIARLV